MLTIKLSVPAPKIRMVRPNYAPDCLPRDKDAAESSEFFTCVADLPGNGTNNPA